MKQYLDLADRIVQHGKWKEVGRNGVQCKTVISERFQFDCANAYLPLVTTGKTLWKAAVAELLGYIRGYTNAADFRALGTKSWDRNANNNESWLNNCNRGGVDDMGIVYGAVGNEWPEMYIHAPGCSIETQGDSIDLLEKIYNDLKAGIDDRGEIWTFWNPGLFQYGCLRPCLHSHQFSLLDGELYLDSTQRSVDVPLGLKWNMPQVAILLQVMAQITGHKAKVATLNMVNCHIYENQYETMRDIQLKREIVDCAPTLKINPNIKTLEDLRTWVTVDDFEVVGYEHHPFIPYAFTE